MEEMISYCGVVCTRCPQYIATQNNDNSLRKKAAERLEKKFGLLIKPEDINCDGCLTIDGRIIGFCDTCEVRKCGSEKEIKNCTVCDEQPCDKLKKIHTFIPNAKASFDSILKETK